MKRGIDKDISPRDKRSRSSYSEREPIIREPIYERRERDEGPGRIRRERDDYRGHDDYRPPREDYRERPEYRDEYRRPAPPYERERDEYDDLPPPKRYRDDPYPPKERRPPVYERSPPPYRDDRADSYYPPPRADYREREKPYIRTESQRDYYDSNSRPPPAPRPPPISPLSPSSNDPNDYRSLCISKINQRINDNALRDVLYEEFKGLGEFNVKIVMTATQRIAYINFRFPHEAKAALEAKSRLVLFNDPVQIGPVIKGRRDNRKSPPPFLRPKAEEYPPPPGPRSPPDHHRPVIKRNDEYERPPSAEVPPFGPPGEDGAPFVPRSKNPPKFPHHLNHVAPEDDTHSTRNLFIGNLDMGITEDDIKESFGKFGQIEDIDIKKPARGTGNAYAFLRFKNLDMAHRAKVALSGSRVGKFNCKIGYGQICPTKCLWVGGLGPWIRPEDLEKEFDRFGVIMSTFWPGGRNYAFILYDDVEAAKAAHDGMRGAPLGGPERRIRTDYVEPEEIPARGPDGTAVDAPPGTDQPPPPGFESFDMEPPGFPRRDRSPRPPALRDDYPPGEEPPNYLPRGRSPAGNGDSWRRRSRTPEPVTYKDFPRERGDSARFRSTSRDRRDGRRKSELDRIKSAMDLPKHFDKAWQGGMVLKSSAFPTEMHLVEGDRILANDLLRDPSSKSGGGTLKITQRLRLLQPKLDDLTDKLESAKVRGQYAILLAVNAPSNVVDNPTNSLQIRPLRNLVTYLEQKDSAGVISLPPGGATKSKDEVGVLHAFPPCPFTKQLLVKHAPNIILDPGTTPAS